MAGMDKISEAIMDKVRAEAESLIKEAGSKAEETIARARKQQEARLLEEKGRMIEESREEAARIMARAAMGARQETLAAKTAVVNEIIGRAKKELAALSGSEKVLISLAKEGIGILGADRVRIYVSARDTTPMQRLVQQDKELARVVSEVRGQDFLGGVIVEAMDGKNRIDNTFETRLEMLLPRVLPEIEKELFGAGA